jgi:hypothetical protein
LKLASRSANSALEKNLFRFFRLRKRLSQRFRYRPGPDKPVLFVVGCQRSGTSMMHHLFRLDMDTVTYDEVSPISDQDPVEGLRLNPLDWVLERFRRDRAGFIVAKPLVESQNLPALLDHFPNSQAIWMYRHYQDVVISNLEFFGADNGHRDLEPILAANDADWRAQNLAPRTAQRIRKLHAEGKTDQDAAALFWIARNSLFVDGDFARDNRVRVCRYGDLVAHPSAVMQQAYAFLGRPYPGDRIVADVFSGSRGRGKSVELHPAIEAECQEILEKLDTAPGLRPEE